MFDPTYGDLRYGYFLRNGEWVIHDHQASSFDAGFVLGSQESHDEVVPDTPDQELEMPPPQSIAEKPAKDEVPQSPVLVADVKVEYPDPTTESDSDHDDGSIAQELPKLPVPEAAPAIAATVVIDLTLED